MSAFLTFFPTSQTATFPAKHPCPCHLHPHPSSSSCHPSASWRATSQLFDWLAGQLVSWSTGQPMLAAQTVVQLVGWLVCLVRQLVGLLFRCPVAGSPLTKMQYPLYCIDSTHSIMCMFIFTYPLNCQHRISLWTPNCNKQNYYSIYLGSQFCCKIIYCNKNVKCSHVQSITLRHSAIPIYQLLPYS